MLRLGFIHEHSRSLRLRVVIRRDLTIQPFGFFDESGKWQDKDFICLCGYLSTDEKWTEFLERWRRVLDKHCLGAMHLWEFRQRCKAQGWTAAQVDSVLSEFVDVIRDCILIGFAIGLDAKHYRGMPSHAQRALGDPGVLCLHRLLRLIRDRLRKEQYTNRIAVTFDEDETYAGKWYRTICRLRKANADLGHYIGAVSFADDTFILPLQAADVLTGLTGQWFRTRAAKGDAPMPPMLDRVLRSPDVPGHGVDMEEELWDGPALNKSWKELVWKRKAPKDLTA